MPLNLPVAIDLTGNLGMASNEGNGTLATSLTQFGEPFQVGTNLYIILASSTVGQLFAFKSTDHGATWTVQDAANGRTYFDLGKEPFSACFDGVATISTVGYDGTNDKHLKIQDFDTTTDTWGVLGAAGPLVSTAFGLPDTIIFFRPDGSKIIIYGDVIAGFRRLTAVVFSGGVFGVPFVIDTNKPAGTDSSDYAKAVLDDSGSGDLHVVFWTFKNAPFGTFNLFYQQILSTDVLGVFSTVITGGNFDAETFGTPIQAGVNFIIPISRQEPLPNLSVTGVAELISGTPKNAPVVWTDTHARLDPLAASDDTQVGSTGAMVLDGGTGRLHLMYPFYDASLGFRTILRHLWTDDLVTFGSWSGETVFDNSVTPVVINAQELQYPTLEISGTNMLFGMAANLIGQPDLQTFFLSVSVLPPPLPPEILLTLIGNAGIFLPNPLKTFCCKK